MNSEVFEGEVTVECFTEMESLIGHCPVCGGPLQYNPRTGRYGQWAHFLCNTKPHIKRYGKKVIDSRSNGRMVCSLECNNAVQLNYKSQPILCDQLAEAIRKEENIHE